MYLATYGTLRYGEGNWTYFLRGCDFLGTHQLEGFSLYSNGAFPYAIKDEGSSIVVDLFEVDQMVLNSCDHLEGYPHHYDRMLVTVGDVEAWVYFVRDVKYIRENFVLIENGDWKKRLASLDS